MCDTVYVQVLGGIWCLHIVLTYTVVCVSKTRLPFRCHGARHADWERGRHVVNVMPGPVLFRRAPVACCLRIFGALCESLEVIYCDSLSLRRLIDFVFRCCLYKWMRKQYQLFDKMFSIVFITALSQCCVYVFYVLVLP